MERILAGLIYADSGAAAYEAQPRDRAVRRLRRHAGHLGLIHLATAN